MVDQSPKSSKQSSKAKAPSESDQRYLPRWEAENRVLYRLDKEAKPRECTSKDISCGGACLKTKEQLSPKQKVKLTIYLENDVSIQVDGQIVWQRPQDGQNLVGVLFANTSQKAQDMILKYAFEIKKDELIKHWYSGWEKKN